MDFWQTVWATAIGGAVLGVLAWLTARVLSVLQRRLKSSPDFRLTKRSGDGDQAYFELERTQKRTAFAVIVGEGFLSSSSADMLLTSARQQLGDIPAGETQSIWVNHGTSIWLSWVDRKRKYSKSVQVDELGSVDIQGLMPTRSGVIRT